jgi:ATP-binding cassette subfamily F protein uup
LVTFPGVVVVVSHDRYFLNRVCTGILAFEGDGRVVHSVGDYDYYLEKRKRAAAESEGWRSEPATPASAAAKTGRAVKPRKLTFKEQRELAGMEAVIQQAEENVARIEVMFADPDFHRKHGHQTGELTAELAAAKKEVARWYARWEELEAIRAEGEAAKSS